MQTVGQYLKIGRRGKGLSIADLEEITHIKKHFLKSLERVNWNDLPEYPVLLGFIKNISSSLDLDQNKAVALFRRDYPPQKLNTPPPPAVKLQKEFHFSPRLAFLLGIIIFALIIVGYLAKQYVGFISPPALEVYEPTQNQIVDKPQLEVVGKTTPDVTIKVNNQPVLVSDGGIFKTTLDIYSGTTDVEINATSRSGKQTVIHRTIKPQIKDE